MIKNSIALGIIMISMLLAACTNNAADVKEDVYDTKNNENINKSNDVSQEVIPSNKGLAQIEIVKLMEEKKYLFYKLKIPYDEYREIYLQYFKKDEGIDDKFFYTAVIHPGLNGVTMSDFIGKDIVETREYLERLGTSLEVYDKLIEDYDDVMHKIEISEVYDDYSKDWIHVYVQKTVQSKNHLSNGRAKYTFEKVDGEYKIVHLHDGWDFVVSKEGALNYSKEEFNSILKSKSLFKDKNYIEVVDMKELVGKTSKEESWDYLFDE